MILSLCFSLCIEISGNVVIHILKPNVRLPCDISVSVDFKIRKQETRSNETKKQTSNEAKKQETEAKTSMKKQRHNDETNKQASKPTNTQHKETN